MEKGADQEERKEGGHLQSMHLYLLTNNSRHAAPHAPTCMQSIMTASQFSPVSILVNVIMLRGQPGAGEQTLMI
jgi:hypothetical protein